MTITPRATPIVVAPPLPSPPPSVSAPERRPLTAAVLVVCRGRQYDVRDGSLLVGRSPECEVLLADSLVSRIHARIRADASGATIEDLHSTNGVYLRGERITHAARLLEGDRILVGANELSVFEAQPEPAPPSSRERLSDISTKPGQRDTPVSLEVHELVGDESPLLKGPLPVTARAAALDMVGSLAHRLAYEGKPEEAARVLVPHLRRILRGASSGLDATEELCEQAARHALAVAAWTSDPLWLDYIIQLHLIAKKVISREAIGAIQRSERWIGPIDRLLLQYYIDDLSSRRSRLGPDQLARLRLLGRLAETEGRSP